MAKAGGRHFDQQFALAGPSSSSSTTSHFPGCSNRTAALVRKVTPPDRYFVIGRRAMARRGENASKPTMPRRPGLCALVGRKSILTSTLRVLSWEAPDERRTRWPVSLASSGSAAARHGRSRLAGDGPSGVAQHGAAGVFGSLGAPRPWSSRPSCNPPVDRGRVSADSAGSTGPRGHRRVPVPRGDSWGPTLTSPIEDDWHRLSRN